MNGALAVLVEIYKPTINYVSLLSLFHYSNQINEKRTKQRCMSFCLFFPLEIGDVVTLCPSLILLFFIIDCPIRLRVVMLWSTIEIISISSSFSLNPHAISGCAIPDFKTRYQTCQESIKQLGHIDMDGRAVVYMAWAIM